MIKDFLKKIKKEAKANPKEIVFPEAFDERILKAASIISKEGIAKPILLGNVAKIMNKAKKMKLPLNKVQIIDHLKSPKIRTYATEFYRLRKKKGLKLKESKKLMKEGIYFGTMMVHMGDADGLLSGAVHPTAHTLRPALQIIKTKKKFHKVSGLFLIIKGEKLYFFADAAVIIDPTAEELAEIAIDSAETAKRFGVRPKVAMLSFSTKGSAEHPLVDKVRKATEIVKKRKPNLTVDGEMQVDAAVVPRVCKIKCPKCRIKGDANILIFPDLQSANISYKLVERLAKAEAIGPILQGLRKPINDLSRGCDVEDIVNLTAITVVEAQNVS